MSHAAHFSVSLEPDLLNEFDRFCGDRQCPNWSEAVRQLLREKLKTAPWTSDTSHAVATLTLVYGHRGTKLTERLLKVQHERLDVVVSTTHIHLDHATCLEVIILQGRVNELQIIASRLCGLKGVHSGSAGRSNVRGAGTAPSDRLFRSERIERGDLTMLPVFLFSALMMTTDQPANEAPRASECLARVRAIHGAAGPWAVAGYRVGERALSELKLPRHSFSLMVVHRCPAQVQYSCVADGLQAATGASPGKLNLRVEAAPAEHLSTTVEDSKTGRRLTFTLLPAFVHSIKDLPYDRLEEAGRRVASLPDDEIFHVTETQPSRLPPRAR